MELAEAEWLLKNFKTPMVRIDPRARPGNTVWGKALLIAAKKDRATIQPLSHKRTEEVELRYLSKWKSKLHDNGTLNGYPIESYTVPKRAEPLAINVGEMLQKAMAAQTPEPSPSPSQETTKRTHVLSRKGSIKLATELFGTQPDDAPSPKTRSNLAFVNWVNFRHLGDGFPGGDVAKLAHIGPTIPIRVLAITHETLVPVLIARLAAAVKPEDAGAKGRIERASNKAGVPVTTVDRWLYEEQIPRHVGNLAAVIEAAEEIFQVTHKPANPSPADELRIFRESLRKYMGEMTVGDLAMRSGTPKSVIIGWLSGDRPSPEALERVANHFKTTVYRLMNGVPPPPNNQPKPIAEVIAASIDEATAELKALPKREPVDTSTPKPDFYASFVDEMATKLAERIKTEALKKLGM